MTVFFTTNNADFNFKNDVELNAFRRILRNFRFSSIEFGAIKHVALEQWAQAFGFTFGRGGQQWVQVWLKIFGGSGQYATRSRHRTVQPICGRLRPR